MMPPVRGPQAADRRSVNDTFHDNRDRLDAVAAVQQLRVAEPQQVDPTVDSPECAFMNEGTLRMPPRSK